jgi:ubiquitin thioesterase protein OTUB1
MSEEDSHPADAEMHPDLMTLEQLDNIRNEIVTTQPLLGSVVPILELLPTYKDSESVGFVPGIEFLARSFKGMRKIRGDGNCFYRALLFSYLESLVHAFASDDEKIKDSATNEHKRFSEKVKGSLQDLVALGYPEFTLEVFYDELVELVTQLPAETVESLEEMFQENGRANYVTWYMRALTAGYLRKDPDRFLPFVEGSYYDIDAFCKAEVEPMDKECEHIQIIALTEYLGVRVRIAYLDGRAFDLEKGLAFVNFPDSISDVEASSDKDIFKVNLLYRPGHYDVLYE